MNITTIQSNRVFRMFLFSVLVVLLCGSIFTPFISSDQSERSDSGYHLVAKTDGLQANLTHLNKTYQMSFFIKLIIILAALFTLRFSQTLLPRFTQTNAIPIRMRSLFLMPLKFNSNYVIL